MGSVCATSICWRGDRAPWALRASARTASAHSVQVDDIPTGDVPLDPSAMVTGTGLTRDNVDQTAPTGSTAGTPVRGGTGTLSASGPP